MSILTLLLLIILIIAAVMGISILSNKTVNAERIRYQISYIKSIGLFALVFGIFTQLLGLYGAFIAIESWGSVSPAILAKGLWTSSIPNFYGITIFLLSYLLWFGLNTRLKKFKRPR